MKFSKNCLVVIALILDEKKNVKIFQKKKWTGNSLKF